MQSLQGIEAAMVNDVIGNGRIVALRGLGTE